MNTARRPSNSAPQVIDRYPPRSRANTSEAPRSHPQPLDPNPQTVPTPDLFMNQSQRPGLSRTHASYSSPPTQPFPAQLYPAHLQNLAPNSYPGPPSSPGFNHWQGQSPVQVNRVATLPNPLPQHFHHGRPPQHPHLASPSSPAPAYSDPEFIPPIPHQTIPRQLTPPNIQHAGLPEQPIPQSQSHPRTSPPPPPITEDLPPPRSPPRTPASPTDEAELALAIELSQKMVMEQKEREEKLRRQEEEELERALAQSMLETTSYGSIHPDFLLDDQIASSSKTKLDSPPPVESKTPSRDDSQLTQSPTAEPSVLPQPAELGRYDKSRIPGYDAASMALSEVAAGKQPVSGDNFSTLPPPPEVDGDPVRVAQDGDTVLSNFPPYDSSRSTSPLHIPKPLDNESSNSTSNPTSTESLYEPTSTLDSLESPSELAYYDDVPSTPVPLDRPPSSINPTSEETPSLFTGNRGIANRGISPPPRPASIHVPQASSVVMLGSPGPSPPSSYNPQRQDISSSLGLERVSSNGSLGSTSQNTAALGRPAPPASVATSVPQLGNVNHYIDPDLLLGVSIDFRPPVLQAQLRPMTVPIPNIITLPYGRCPPLHIQAPSWKHLLKLLARMGNTKFEPTVKALSITKTELKLRTVIQFVRLNPASEEWRTILWFTIDHPVPPSLPNAHKYTNPHPNMLPWSYSLGDLPILLRNAADAPMSKTYTIPATESLPYPTLPINFPNLALYLQAALDFSRQAKEDNNGYRKLAKMVQACYPNTEEPSNEAQEKTTVGGLFKRVIGRGNNKKKTGKSNNEETYEYITPFVPDEWG